MLTRLIICQSSTAVDSSRPSIPMSSVDDDPTGTTPNRHRRTVRSFVARAGRMTAGQERAWRELWPRYGLHDDAGPLDLDALFGRQARRRLEIGFGNGEALVALAANHRDEDFLGIEVHRPGVGHLMLRAAELNLGNLRVACRDAVEVLEHDIPDASLDAVMLYFPDPWPKKRHHKRRIVQPAFVMLVARKLRPGGHFRLATDWEPYAEQMLAVTSACPDLENEHAPGFGPRPDSRPLTRFELRGQRLGHEVWDLALTRR
jgi:tRNA (guanine-N7-)-methyltransferase